MKQYITPTDRAILSEEVDGAEKRGRLTERQLEVIYRNNWFNLFVPKAYGGLAIDFIDALNIEEQLARIDGSIGWTVTLCAGANMFVGFIDPKESKGIFLTKEVCFGGSGKVSGTAEVIEDGYVINGTWDIVTGLPHCTVFTANAHLVKEGQLQLDAKGKPIYKSFFFFPDEVKVKESWNALGLKATASHSIEIKTLTVPKSRSFSIQAEACSIDNALYRFPFYSFARFTLGVNQLGMQAHYVEELKAYFDSIKGNAYEDFQVRLVQDLEQAYLGRRKELYDLAELIWGKVKRGECLSEQDELAVSAMCKNMVKKGKEEVLHSLPYVGMHGVDLHSPISRVVRDILTGGQHGLFL